MMLNGNSQTNLIANDYIFHTDNPLPGIDNLGGSLYEPDLLHRIKGSFTFRMLVSFVNDALHLPFQSNGVQLNKIVEDDVEDVKICPDNHSIWLVKIKESYGNLKALSQRVEPSHVLHNEAHITTGDNQNAGHEAHITTGDNQNAGHEAHITTGDNQNAGHQASLDDTWQTFDTKNMVTIEDEDLDPQSPMIYVGIIDSVSHNSNNYNSTEAYHADVLARIIHHSTKIKPYSIPLLSEEKVEKKESPSVFDLICALSRKSEIDKVQVINISHGYRSLMGNGVLRRVIRDIKKPIICSAGNDNRDNDIKNGQGTGHWPSNFTTEMTNVIAVTSVDEGENYFNYGENSVDICAPGSWGINGKRLVGTSFAAAWISRMFALAFAKEKRVNMNLHEVLHSVETIYHVDEDYTAVPTQLSTKYTREPSKIHEAVTA